MMRRINRFVAAVLLLGAQGPTFAAQHAHVHGLAKLQVAVDGPTLTLVLSSPLDNLLGFEHAPRTAKEKAAAADLTARLGKPETLLVPSPAAGCTVASAKVDAPTLEGHSAAKSAARGTTAAPAHSEKAGHDHGEHSDVTAEYVFRCQRP